MRNPNIRKVSEQAKAYTENELKKRFIQVETGSGVMATLDRVAYSRLPGREQNKLLSKDHPNYNPYYDKQVEALPS